MMRSLIIRNYKKIERLELLDLDRPRIISIIGAANTGKTHVGEAILWALSDKLLRNERTAGDIVRHGASEAHVELIYKDYSLVATYPKGKPRNAVRKYMSGPQYIDATDKAMINWVRDSARVCPLPVLLRASYILLQTNGRLDTFINWPKRDTDRCLDHLLGTRFYRKVGTKLRDMVKWRRTRVQRAEFSTPILQEELRGLQEIVSPTEQEVTRARLGVKSGHYNADVLLDQVLLRKRDLLNSIADTKVLLAREQRMLDGGGKVLQHLEWLCDAYRELPGRLIRQTMCKLNALAKEYIGQVGIYGPSRFVMPKHKPGQMNMPEFRCDPSIGNTDRFYVGIALSLALGSKITGPPGIIFLDLDQELPRSRMRQRWLRTLLLSIARTRGTVIITGHPQLADEVVPLPGSGRPMAAMGGTWKSEGYDFRLRHYVANDDPKRIACYHPGDKALEPDPLDTPICERCKTVIQLEKEVE